MPFEVSGPWTKLHYKPDMKALGSSLMNQVSSGGIGGLLGGLVGGNKANASAPNSGNASQKSGFSLGNLFGH